MIKTYNVNTIHTTAYSLCFTDEMKQTLKIHRFISVNSLNLTGEREGLHTACVTIPHGVNLAVSITVTIFRAWPAFLPLTCYVVSTKHYLLSGQNGDAVPQYLLYTHFSTKFANTVLPSEIILVLVNLLNRLRKSVCCLTFSKSL